MKLQVIHLVILGLWTYYTVLVVLLPVDKSIWKLMCLPSVSHSGIWGMQGLTLLPIINSIIYKCFSYSLILWLILTDDALLQIKDDYYQYSVHSIHITQLNKSMLYLIRVIFLSPHKILSFNYIIKIMCVCPKRMYHY